VPGLRGVAVVTPDLRMRLMECAMRAYVYAAIATAFLAMPPCRCRMCDPNP
jgi:hypothetical protein